MRNPFAGPALPTLADVMMQIEKTGDLSPGRKASIGSAVSTAGRWFNMPPSAIPAHPEFLRRLFEGFLPAAAGVTAKRVSNVKSEILFALRHLKLVARGSYLAQMTPEWELLWQALPDKYARTSFSRFFRYASAQGMAPADVTDDVASKFLVALKGETLVKHPEVTHQNLCRAWNRMHRVVPGWPDVVLQVPRYADHYILSWTEFPASFQEDVERYLAHLGHEDVLDLNAPLRRLRGRTIKGYSYQLRRAASILVHKGHPATQITSLAYLVEPKQVEDVLRFVLARNDNKPMATAFDLGILLGKVAKHWVKASAETIETIKRYAHNVCPAKTGIATKNRQRLAPLRDEKNLVKLLILPGKMCKAAEEKNSGRRKDALLMQHAAALAILNYAPIRIGNLASLHLEKNLRWSGPGRTGTLVIDIDGSDVKNRQSLSFPLPPACADLVRLYLDKYQPRLSTGPSPHLFPSDLPGRAKRSDTLGKQLSRLILKTIGLEVNPHLYRHLVHLVVLNRYPGAYAMVLRILGHKSLQTAISNYAGEDIAMAMRSFQELISDTLAGRKARPSLGEIASGLNAAPHHRRTRG
jgi:integrase